MDSISSDIKHETIFDGVVAEFKAQRIPGWCPPEKAINLMSIIFALRPKVVVETGVFGGKSLIPMALALKAIGSGKAIGIDPWRGNIDHEEIYQGFVENVKRLGLEPFIEVQRAKSDDVKPPKVIDCAHFDGQHAAQVLREVKRFGSRVRIGGIVVLDDLSWANDGVNHVAQAVELLLKSGFIELYRVKQSDGEWGVFQRVK